MPRSAATLVRIAGPSFFSLLLCMACNSAKPASSAREPEVALAAPAHTVQTDIPVHVASAEPTAAHSCGGAEPGSCCGGGQGEGSCGQNQGHGSCGQASADHATSCGGASDRLPDEDNVHALTRIEDPSQVCMVRNHFMGRPQLAIQAEGSTYYGCCAGCANRLLQDARARQAIDPVSHNPVDKGLAVLAKTSRGAVLYFENEANMQTFRATMQ